MNQDDIRREQIRQADRRNDLRLQDQREQDRREEDEREGRRRLAQKPIAQPWRFSQSTARQSDLRSGKFSCQSQTAPTSDASALKSAMKFGFGLASAILVGLAAAALENAIANEVENQKEAEN